MAGILRRSSRLRFFVTIRSGSDHGYEGMTKAGSVRAASCEVHMRAVMAGLPKALNSLLPSGKLWINQATRDLRSDIYCRMRN
jgi:hypothetical protein